MMVGLAVATLGLIFILCAHDGKFEVVSCCWLSKWPLAIESYILKQ